MLRHLATLVLLFCATLIGTDKSYASERYFGVMVGSRHFGTDMMNDKTPGLTFGNRWEGRKPGSEWFMEGGIFMNSYEEISPIVLFGTSTSLGHIGQTEVRGGIAIGTAYYRELSVRLQDRHGIPNIAGFIPIVAASIALRRGTSEIRFTAVPPDSPASFVLNLSLTHAF